jgi:hypothetical protein
VVVMAVRVDPRNLEQLEIISHNDFANLEAETVGASVEIENVSDDSVGFWMDVILYDDGEVVGEIRDNAVENFDAGETRTLTYTIRGSRDIFDEYEAVITNDP